MPSAPLSSPPRPPANGTKISYRPKKHSSAARLSFLALVLCGANEVGSVQTDACVDLNFRAAALQGSDDACVLLSAVVGAGDILAGDAADVDASCSARTIPVEEGGGGAVANRTARDCVDDVAEVVDGIARGGCEVTGG